MGEFNADMVVNFSDYLILSQNFGFAFGASVPEPRHDEPDPARWPGSCFGGKSA
jgi:hypothetical protein